MYRTEASSISGISLAKQLNVSERQIRKIWIYKIVLSLHKDNLHLLVKEEIKT